MRIGTCLYMLHGVSVLFVQELPTWIPSDEFVLSMLVRRIGVSEPCPSGPHVGSGDVPRLNGEPCKIAFVFSRTVTH